MKKVICLLALYGVAGFAQVREELPETVLMILSSVKPEMQTEYIALQKEVMAARQKAYAFNSQYQTLLGDRQVFVSIMPTKLAQLDGPSPTSTALGAAGFAQYLARTTRYTTGSRWLLLKTRRDLSITETALQQLPVMVMTRLRVASGRVSEFEEQVKNNILPAMKKAGVKRYVVAQVVAGGGTTEFFTFRNHEKVADADVGAPPQGKPGVVTFTERSVLRINREISFRSGQ